MNDAQLQRSVVRGRRLLITFFVAGQLSVLAPYKHLIVSQYGSVILVALAILFLNLFVVFYLLTRSLFLKDTGRKLGGKNGARDRGRNPVCRAKARGRDNLARLLG